VTHREITSAWKNCLAKCATIVGHPEFQSVVRTQTLKC